MIINTLSTTFHVRVLPARLSIHRSIRQTFSLISVPWRFTLTREISPYNRLLYRDNGLNLVKRPKLCCIWTIWWKTTTFPITGSQWTPIVHPWHISTKIVLRRIRSFTNVMIEISRYAWFNNLIWLEAGTSHIFFFILPFLYFLTAVVSPRSNI